MKSAVCRVSVLVAVMSSGFLGGCGGVDEPDQGVNEPSADLVTSSLTSGFPNNARISGDFFYVRDANGNRIAGRRVDDGDNIIVLDVGYTSQLTLVEYPTPSGTNIGYIKNVPSLIKYYHQGEWTNDSTSKNVYDINGKKIGLLFPFETATPLYKMPNGMYHVVYDTDKGVNTKSGYVYYHGNFAGFRSAPSYCVAPPPETPATPSDSPCENTANQALLTNALCLAKCGVPAVGMATLKCSFLIPALPEALPAFGLCVAGWLGTTDAQAIANCLTRCWTP